MDIITLTSDNLEKEHICCAIANNEDCQVVAKKSWLKEQFKEGLVFKKADVRGKVFIEYIPAEKAWYPIVARDYMFINCLWISGQYKGQGISNRLLDECIADSKEKGKKGLVILSSNKKIPYIADKKYLLHKGFEVIDYAKPYYELLYLPFVKDVEKPRFNNCAKEGRIEEEGFVLYYSFQCPFSAKYVPIIQRIAEERGIPFKAIQYKTAVEAQNAPVATTTYSLFYEGVFVTNDILSEKKFLKILMQKGL